jgi:uncharacterized protein YbjQ (UPF0145 family)
LATHEIGDYMKGLVTVLISGVMLALPAMADEITEFSIDDVMTSVRATETLKDDMPFYYGNQDYSTPVKVLSEATTQQKINGFLKSDRNACELAFLAAMKELKAIAIAKGGNAVVSIHSNLEGDSVERKSGTYACISKTTVAQVSLAGTIVILED